MKKPQPASAYKVFEDLEFKAHPFMDGVQAKEFFPNGYGVSVIQTTTSYTSGDKEYELAVFKNGRLCYDTPSTNDVIGHIKKDEVTSAMKAVQDLPGINKEDKSSDNKGKSGLKKFLKQMESDLEDTLKKLEKELEGKKSGVRIEQLSDKDKEHNKTDCPIKYVARVTRAVMDKQEEIINYINSQQK